MHTQQKLHRQVIAVALHRGKRRAAQPLLIVGHLVLAVDHLAALHGDDAGEIAGGHVQPFLKHMRQIAVQRQLHHALHQAAAAHGIVLAHVDQVVDIGLGVPDAKVSGAGIEKAQLIIVVLKRLEKIPARIAAPRLAKPCVDRLSRIKFMPGKHMHHRGEGADIGRVAVIVIGKVAQRVQTVRIYAQHVVNIIIAEIVQQDHDHIFLRRHGELLFARKHIGVLFLLVRAAGNVLHAHRGKGGQLHGQQRAAQKERRLHRALSEKQQKPRHARQHRRPYRQVAPAVGSIPCPIDLLAVQQPQIQVEESVLHIAGRAKSRRERQTHAEGAARQKGQKQRQPRRAGKAYRPQAQGSVQIGKAKVARVARVYLHAAPYNVHKAQKEAGQQRHEQLFAKPDLILFHPQPSSR